MKLFLIIITTILFTACSSDPDSSTQKNNDKRPRKKQQRPEIVEKKAPDHKGLNSSDSDFNPVSTEEDKTETDLVAENTPEETRQDKTESEQLVSLEETPTSSPVPAPFEDIISLDLTEDQLLVFQIREKYQHYLDLKKAWEEEYAPRLEVFIEQASNQKFLTAIRHVESHHKITPVTMAQIEDMEEQVKEGVFAYEEDRKSAQEAHETLFTSVDGFEAAINLSLEYAKVAEQDPSVLLAENYEETTDEQSQKVEDPVVVENKETNPESIVPLKTPVVEESPEKIIATPVIVDSSKEIPEEIMTEEEVVVDVPEDTIAEQEIVEVMSDLQNEETLLDNEADSTEEETFASDLVDSESAEDMTADVQSLEEEELPDTDTQSVEEEKLPDTDTQSVEEETSFIDDIIAWWNAFDLRKWWYETFDLQNPTQLLEDPKTLSVPETNTPVPEEEKTYNSTEAQGLISSLLDNLYQLVQERDIGGMNELLNYLDDIQTTAPQEITPEESVLLNQIKEVAQSLETEDIAGFVESSGYSSERLQKEELIMILEMISGIVETKDKVETPSNLTE